MQIKMFSILADLLLYKSPYYASGIPIDLADWRIIKVGNSEIFLVVYYVIPLPADRSKI